MNRKRVTAFGIQSAWCVVVGWLAQEIGFIRIDMTYIVLTSVALLGFAVWHLYRDAQEGNEKAQEGKEEEETGNGSQT